MASGALESNGVQRLEHFFQQDATQKRLADFMHGDIEVNTVFAGGTLDAAAEQRHDYHAAWRRYEELLDRLLEEFLASPAAAGVSRDALLHDLALIPDSWDMLVCAPYVDAGLNYEHFLSLVAEWKESYDIDDPDLASAQAGTRSAG